MKRMFKNIKTLNDACEALNVNVDTVVTANDTKDEAAYKKLKIITAAINDGWKPDWSKCIRKWYNYIDTESPSSIQCFINKAYFSNNPNILRANIYFESKDKCNWFSDKFLNFFNDFHLTKNNYKQTDDSKLNDSYFF